MPSSDAEPGRALVNFQTSDNDTNEIIAALSDEQSLAQLRGMSREIDLQLGMVGPESLAQILARGLPSAFRANPTFFSQAQELFRTTESVGLGRIKKPALQAVAALLGDIFKANPDLQGEAQYLIWQSFQTSWTRRLREGEPSTFWEEQPLEKVFTSEYAPIEAAVFDRLNQKLSGSARVGTGAVESGPTTMSEGAGTTSTVDYGEANAQALIPLDNSVNLDILAWDEMQRLAQGIDPLVLDDWWKTGPRRSILWLLQNCTQEQLFYYLYHHADKLDAELKGAFIKVLEADNQGQIPLIWKTIAMRALLRSA